MNTAVPQEVQRLQLVVVNVGGMLKVQRSFPPESKSVFRLLYGKNSLSDRRRGSYAHGQIWTAKTIPESVSNYKPLFIL